MAGEFQPASCDHVGMDDNVVQMRALASRLHTARGRCARSAAAAGMAVAGVWSRRS